jgi:hypothetical protein
MAIETIFAIVMLALAVLLFGSILLVRNRRREGADPSFGFKDCYDLCLNDPKREEWGELLTRSASPILHALNAMRISYASP